MSGARRRRPGRGGPWPALLLGLVLAGAAAPPVQAADPHAPLRRILLISVDTLSAAHLSGYGYAEPTSNVLDSLATQGMLFRHCLVP